MSPKRRSAVAAAAGAATDRQSRGLIEAVADFIPRRVARERPGGRARRRIVSNERPVKQRAPQLLKQTFSPFHPVARRARDHGSGHTPKLRRGGQ